MTSARPGQSSSTLHLLPPAARRPVWARGLAALFGTFGLLALASGCATGSPRTESAAPPAEAATPAEGSPDPHDLPALDARLRGPGLEGHMHGAVADSATYVFTYRKPGDFFDYVDLPLVPRGEAAAALAELGRHDKVRLFGRLAKVDSPKPHVYVERVELVERWEGSPEVPSYRHSDPATADAPRQEIAKVHAVDGEGAVLVVEVGDRVIPVFVDRPELTRELWRNDKIRVHFAPAPHPSRPGHLTLDPEVEAPIERLEAIATGHGEPLTLEGALILFPRSPQLTFDIYALQVVDDDRIRRNYTLVNFEDPAAFEAIRARLAEIWAESSGEVERNKLRHPTVRIRATGTKNVVSPAQANPQLLLEGPDAITVLGP